MAKVYINSIMSKFVKKLNLNNYDILLCFILGLVAFFSRFLLLEKIQSHWDGPQYSIAVVRFSLIQQTPAPPGYPLYIAMGKFFYIFFKDPHFAILMVSVLASVVGAIALYLVGKAWYHRIVGLTASIIFLTGSTFYYFGLTPYAYLTIPATTTLLAFITYLIYVKKGNNLGIIFGIVFGISFGIRPQETFQIFGLLILGFLFLTAKEKIKAVITFTIITLIWVIPLLYYTGVLNFVNISISFLLASLTHSTVFQRLELIVKGFLLSFGLSSLALLYYFWKIYKDSFKISNRYYKTIIFYSAWILPSFAYNLLLRSEHAGYQMSYLAALLMLVSYAVWKVIQNNKQLFILIVFCIAVFNLYWFFYNRDPRYVLPYRPTSFHYSDIRKNDLKTGSKVNFILSKFNPKNTIIITNSVLWRPYGYYLKKYEVVSLDGLADNTPGILHLERDQKDWNMRQFENKNLTLIIPKNVTDIVFPDDENYQYIINYPYKVFNLPGNSKVTLLKVNSGDVISYKFHYLTVFKAK